MVTTEASVLVDRPADAVWRFMTDWSNAPKWDPAVIEMRQTSSGPVGVGTTLQSDRRKTPKVMNSRVSAYEPGLKLGLEITSGPIKGSIGTFRIETVEGRTRLTDTTVFKFSGFAKLLAPFLGRAMTREGETFVDNIKRLVESEARV